MPVIYDFLQKPKTEEELRQIFTDCLELLKDFNGYDTISVKARLQAELEILGTPKMYSVLHDPALQMFAAWVQQYTDIVLCSKLQDDYWDHMAKIDEHQTDAIIAAGGEV